MKRLIQVLTALIFVVGVATLFLSARIPDYATQQRKTVALVGPLNWRSPVQQSLVPEAAYLSAIKLSATVLEGGARLTEPAFLKLSLFDPTLTSGPVAVQEIRLPARPGSFEALFTFPAQGNSAGRRYLLMVETNAQEGVVALWGSAANAYSGGELVSASPTNPRDLAFWTYARPPLLVSLFQLFQASASRLALSWVGLFFYFLLGYNFISQKELVENSLSQNLISPTLFGLTVPILTLLAFSLFHLRVEKELVSLVAVGLCLVSLIRLLWHRLAWKRLILGERKTGQLLLLVFSLVILTRVAQIEPLLVPNWRDGLTHTKLVENLLQAGGLSAEALYHTGFHANLYFLSLLLQLPVPETMLVFGQLLGSLSGLALFLWVDRFSKDFYLALISACLFWFWLPFPAYLVAWGRYPFLFGLVLLPLALFELINLMEKSAPSQVWRLVRAGLVAFSLFFTHYGAFILFGIFGSLALLRDLPAFGRQFKLLLTLFVPTLVLLGLKLGNLFSRVGFLEQFQQTNLPLNLSTFAYQINLFLEGGGLFVCLIALTGFYLVLTQTGRPWLGLIQWVFLALMIHLGLEYFRLPVTGIANFIIFLSLPVSILAGFSLNCLFQAHPRLVGLILSLGILVGAYAQLGLIPPTTVLLTRADQQAFEWIRTQTAPDSVFLINGYLWRGEHPEPADGGGWLSILTGRKTYLPGQVEASTVLTTLFENEPADYIYLGNGYGVLDLTALEAFPRLSMVYNQAGIQIFEVLK